VPQLVHAFASAVPVLALALSSQVKAFVRFDEPIVALEHVRVIDGTGGPAREDQTVVVEKGKIRSVGEAKTAGIPKDAREIDLRDHSVLPGLVGMHDHLFYPTSRGVFAEMPQSFPRLYLACGVTTIRTTGSIEPYTDLEIRKSIDAGKTPGPRMHVTGPYLEGEGSFTPQMHALTGPEDATKTVNFWLDEGVDDFKAYNYLTSAELGAAIQAAHARGAKVTGHLCSIGFREAAALGIDDLEHGLFVDTEFFPWKKPGECAQDARDPGFVGALDLSSAPVKEMIEDLVKHKVAITSTLPVFEMFVPGRPVVQARVLDAMSPDAKAEFQGIKTRIDGMAASGKKDSEFPWAAAFRKEMEFERAFAKAGGLLLAGEDPTGIGGVLAGFGDQRELELLVEAGFTPLEAIAIATSNGAKYLGLEKEIGTIAAGLRADLVVVKGDPSKRIEDVENVETVFKDGVGYDSAKLIESVRGAVGSR
jgi:imidazolonepropionase-like amidohydrolase